ncbi:MAG: nucleotidyltransferase family protein [Saprospiraceae bacterium]
MQAILFSAGLGTRLQPLTNNLPKALAPFYKTTLLAYNIEFLKSQGVNSFVINTHHFHEKIEDYLTINHNFNTNIHISYEHDLLDTAGALILANNLFNHNEILLYNVDVISNIDIKKLFDFHKNNSNDITLATSNRESSRKIIFSDSGLMIGWKNMKTGEIKSCNDRLISTDKAFSGISVLNTSLIELIGDIQKKSLIAFYLEICKVKKICSYDHSEDYWFDCGTISKLKIAEKFIESVKK